MPREAAGTCASPFSRRDSATSAGSSKVSTSISLMTLANRSSAADSVHEDKLSTRAFARLPSHASISTLISETIADVNPWTAVHVNEQRSDKRQRKGDDKNPQRRKRGPLLRPRDQPLGVNRSPAAGVDDGDPLSEVDAIPQRANPRLTFADVRDRRGMQQPSGKPLLPHRRAARRQQLKQARRSEHVEVVGVRMIAIAKALAAGFVAHPAILDARDAVHVEGDRRLRARQRAHHQFVPDRQRDENREPDPVDRRRRIRRENEGRIDHRGDENRDLGVTEMDMRSFSRRGGGFTFALAGGVFVEGRSHGSST